MGRGGGLAVRLCFSLKTRSLKGTRRALMVIHNPVTLPPERRRRLSCLAARLSGRQHPKRRPLLTRASNLYLDRLGPSFDMGVG